MAGRRVVRESDPATGSKRTWGKLLIITATFAKSDLILSLLTVLRSIIFLIKMAIT